MDFSSDDEDCDDVDDKYLIESGDDTYDEYVVMFVMVVMTTSSIRHHSNFDRSLEVYTKLHEL